VGLLGGDRRFLSIRAGAGGDDYFCQVEKLFVVNPMSFQPPPKADFARLQLTPHAAPLVDRLEQAGRASRRLGLGELIQMFENMRG
jgi:hypothetical protein